MELLDGYEDGKLLEAVRVTRARARTWVQPRPSLGTAKAQHARKRTILLYIRSAIRTHAQPPLPLSDAMPQPSVGPRSRSHPLSWPTHPQEPPMIWPAHG